ncbi:MAG: AAA family ATPase [Leifsonia xyli]|nr:MAG: AAA family ATPase [Leifsonia xyli]
MTPSSIERLPFDKRAARSWGAQHPRHSNWPVVYVIDGPGTPQGRVYVGETVNAAGRIEQHLKAPEKQGLASVRVVIDDTFNKSACHDLESHLIRWFAGDGRYTMVNGNGGMTDADYFDRDTYRESFRDVFERLRAEGLFARSIPEIENDDLFKLSPFKALTPDQAIAVEDILDGLFADLGTGARTTSVVQGNPGTGKTIVAIFLMKLLADIRDYDDAELRPEDSMFAEYFVPENRELLREFRMALVVPQQSLRESIQRVFTKTPKLHRSMVLSPFDVGKSAERFDLLLVDESHRLGQRANQASGPLNKSFADITTRLFGHDDKTRTQLDWIVAQSDHRILMLDAEQSVRPADLPGETTARLLADARGQHRLYPLTSQMRVKADADYVGHVRALLRGERSDAIDLGDYDLRMFDDLGELRRELLAREAEHGLARMVAGYAWDWRSRHDPAAHDIELDGLRLRWNRTATDWINSPGSVDEVGSIHTVQGYDLNYAGVIIGPDLRYDAESGRIVASRENYRDKKGKENNATLGIVYTDDDLLRYIRNVYAVLLTRGIRGTYVYVVDAGLREHLRGMLARPGVLKFTAVP